MALILLTVYGTGAAGAVLPRASPSPQHSLFTITSIFCILVSWSCVFMVHGPWVAARCFDPVPREIRVTPQDTPRGLIVSTRATSGRRMRLVRASRRGLAGARSLGLHALARDRLPYVEVVPVCVQK